ncbi:MAG: hypothetical protein M3680_02770 [Myxococcota bacterium]|nr:hypothetical protein [Myxococcota bacterium]
MAEFHAGFFVRSLAPACADPVRVALAAGLRARAVDPRKLHVSFAAVRACPVMHVTIRNHVGDPKEAAELHHRHFALGAELARAALAEVWAYHCESQFGSEQVQHFAIDGATSEPAACEWRTLAGERGVAYDPHDAAALASLLEAAPLGALAAQLGISRELLEMTLGRAPSRVDVSLASSTTCTEAVTAYLTGALRPPVIISPPDRKLAPSDLEETLYFPGWMGEELVAHARRLGINVGTLVWAAWEHAKPKLYQLTPLFDDYPPEGSLPPAARVRPAPPSKPPASLTVPLDAPPVDRPIDARDKVMLPLVLPARVRTELQSFAVGSDKSLSWIVQQAILLVRHRLLAASAR